MSGHVLRAHLIPHLAIHTPFSCTIRYVTYKKTTKQKQLVYGTSPGTRQRNENRMSIIATSGTPLTECTVLALLTFRTLTSIAWVHIPAPRFPLCFDLEQFIQIPLQCFLCNMW